MLTSTVVAPRAVEPELVGPEGELVVLRGARGRRRHVRPPRRRVRPRRRRVRLQEGLAQLPELGAAGHGEHAQGRRGEAVALPERLDAVVEALRVRAGDVQRIHGQHLHPQGHGLVGHPHAVDRLREHLGVVGRRARALVQLVLDGAPDGSKVVCRTSSRPTPSPTSTCTLKHSTLVAMVTTRPCTRRPSPMKARLIAAMSTFSVCSQGRTTLAGICWYCCSCSGDTERPSFVKNFAGRSVSEMVLNMASGGCHAVSRNASLCQSNYFMWLSTLCNCPMGLFSPEPFYKNLLEFEDSLISKSRRERSSQQQRERREEEPFAESRSPEGGVVADLKKGGTTAAPRDKMPKNNNKKKGSGGKKASPAKPKELPPPLLTLPFPWKDIETLSRGKKPTNLAAKLNAGGGSAAPSSSQPAGRMGGIMLPALPGSGADGFVAGGYNAEGPLDEVWKFSLLDGSGGGGAAAPKCSGSQVRLQRGSPSPFPRAMFRGAALPWEAARRAMASRRRLPRAVAAAVAAAVMVVVVVVVVDGAVLQLRVRRHK